MERPEDAIVQKPAIGLVTGPFDDQTERQNFRSSFWSDLKSRAISKVCPSVICSLPRASCTAGSAFRRPNSKPYAASLLMWGSGLSLR